MSDTRVANRYVVSMTDADGARNYISLTAQLKRMHDLWEGDPRLPKPALIIALVPDESREEAVGLLKGAWNNKPWIESMDDFDPDTTDSPS